MSAAGRDTNFISIRRYSRSASSETMNAFNDAGFGEYLDGFTSGPALSGGGPSAYSPPAECFVAQRTGYAYPEFSVSVFGAGKDHLMVLPACQCTY